MNPPRHVDRQTFLRRLRRSELLTDAQFDAAADLLPETNQGRLLARTLVREGVLTRFQAEQLLAGRTSGFRLGRYRILDRVGQGGMGRVFKAEHRTLGRLVALKVLAPRVLRTGRAQGFFLREARAVAQLDHPNIVAALDAGLDAGRSYLVMEYIDGPNLDELVRTHGPLPVGQACDLARQAADGLAYAGARGMVHRDVKPANLLVQSRAGRAVVKISDFGLARLGGSAGNGADDLGTIEARADTVMGTPDYIAPEQARNLHNADARSDLYSLGCTLYYLLTGAVPFPGGTTLEKLVRATIEDPEPVERLRPEVPPAVASVVRRLMAKSPEDRFQTAAAAAAALEPFCTPAPAPAPASRPSVPFLDGLPTPAGVEDACALVGTVGPGGSSTPMATASLPPASRAPAESRRPFALVRRLLGAGRRLFGW
jgi:serine/threonine-protein kinase